MTKYVLVSAYPHRMSIGIDIEVYGSDEELKQSLLKEDCLSEADINLLLHDGELEDCNGEEPISYKIQVVS